MNTFFTSDTHFNHANIIRYCRRPQFSIADFDSNGNWKSPEIKLCRTQEMDAMLIEKWNSTVTPQDEVYHLGDFCFGGPMEAASYLSVLNFSHLYFIWGNHDKPMHQFANRVRQPEFYKLAKRVSFLGDLTSISVGPFPEIVLCHYSMHVWDGSHHGNWHLFGHSHGTLEDKPNSLSIDVGVDVHGYRPIAIEEVAMYMKKKNFKPVDHHVA